MNSPTNDQKTQSKKEEFGLFMFISFVLLPAMTIGFIGCWGLFVWLTQ